MWVVTTQLPKIKIKTSKLLARSSRPDHVDVLSPGSVDLPPVNATMQPDGHILLRFIHPWLWHHQMTDDNPSPKRQKKSNDARSKKDLPEFRYEILVGEAQVRQHRSRNTALNIVMLLSTTSVNRWMSPVFVVFVQKKEPKAYCENSVCQKKVPVDNVQEKQCVNITGQMENMAVIPTRLACAMPLGSPEPNG